MVLAVCGLKLLTWAFLPKRDLFLQLPEISKDIYQALCLKNYGVCLGFFFFC